MIDTLRSRPDLERQTDALTRPLRARQRVRLPYASEFMTTGRRTRSQVADEAMAVALRVGVCLEAALAALKAGLNERF